MVPLNVGIGETRWQRPGVIPVLVGLLLFVLFVHVIGVCLDFIAAARYPFEIDYGEGLVWQQSILIPGDKMFRASTGFPIILFNYPPLFYVLVRAARWVLPDYLAAGRAVASLGAVAVSPMLFACVMAATRRTGSPRMAAMVGAAVAGGLWLCLDPARVWGLTMRVDLPGVAFGMAGLALAARASGRFWGTLGALIFCLAAVFTKQSLLPAGIAVFLFSVLRRPWPALGAGAVAAGLGVGIVAAMQVVTDGGFLQNIVGANLNRLDIAGGLQVLARELETLPFVVLMLGCAIMVGASLRPILRAGGVRQIVRAVQQADGAQACRILFLLHFILSAAMLVTIFKFGSNLNYLLDWFASGYLMVGITMADMAQGDAGRKAGYGGAVAVITVLVLIMPFRLLPDQANPKNLAALGRIVDRIAAADAPVASENVGLLMRAGKPMWFELANMTDLATQGRWDETPLVQMIANRGFAFMITIDDVHGAGKWRTAAVDRAMREAYPVVEMAADGIWVHSPVGAGGRPDQAASR